jgi:hypothetical protein
MASCASSSPVQLLNEWRTPRVIEATLACAECGREPREDENAEDESRAYARRRDELHTFCPECAAREFSALSEPPG